MCDVFKYNIIKTENKVLSAIIICIQGILGKTNKIVNVASTRELQITKMIFPSFLLALITVTSCLEVITVEECSTCILVNMTCYNVTHLLDLDAPFRNKVVIHKMGILRSDNMLYYSFEPKIEDQEYYKIGFIGLDNQNESGIISGGQKLILNFGTFDIDQDNHLVYLGGSDGIFVLNTSAKSLSPYSSRGDLVVSLFYRNYVYFTKYNIKGIIVKKGDNFQTLLERHSINNFVINKYDVIVFSNNTGLHIGKGETTYQLSNNPFFRGLTMDLDGNIYAWWIDGIYKVLVEKPLELSRVVRIAKLPSIGAMTFDNNNNIIFSSGRGLYKMTESQNSC